MTDSVEERAAREFLEDLIAGGRAVEIMQAYADHGQSCSYVYGILQQVVADESDMVCNGVKNFARNLLDDWSK